MPFKGTGICEVLGTGYMDTKLSGRFLPPMPAVLGFEYGLHSQLPHPQDLRTDPPHHSCYCSNSTVRTLPSKPFCPFYFSVYWNHHSWLHISLHYKPVLTVTIPKVNSTVRFPFSFSFSCRILACITVSWGALGVGARSLDPAQGNSHICTPTGTASLCPLSQIQAHVHPTLKPTATSYFLRKMRSCTELPHLPFSPQNVLCFVTCFLFLFCLVGVFSLKRDIINTVKCPGHKSTAWYSFT